MSDHSTVKPKTSPVELILNFIRGGLIALAELVPGISGGTVALVVGVYERALDAGNQLIGLVKAALTDRSSLKQRAREIDWGLLIPTGIGMVGTVFLFSGIMHDFVENHKEVSRGLFLGMVAVSIIVPLRMVDRVDLKKKVLPAALLFIGFAAATFWATGFTSTSRTDPSLLLFFVAAAIAVCALVLPGVSGSFFLYAIGLYAPTMAAISDRDMKVIVVFGLGALTGLVLFIRILGYLLHRHRTLTLVAMAGLMLGSLRALWPWQTEDAALLAPGDNALKIFGFIILGAAAVAATMVAEKLIQHGSKVVVETEPTAP